MELFKVLVIIGILGVFLLIWFVQKHVNNKLNNVENIKFKIEVETITKQKKLNQKIAELVNNKALSVQEKTELQEEINTIQTELRQQQAELSHNQMLAGKLKAKKYTKRNPIKAIIIYYCFIISIFAIFGGFIFLDNKYDITNSKPKTYTISEPKVEIEAEWFETGNKKYAIEEDNKPYRNDKGKWVMNGVADEGEWKIKIKYTFYGLDGLGCGQHREYEPTDLMPFMKNPFDKWETKLSSIDFFDTFHTKHKNDDSQFNNMFINNYVDHYTELNYKGPKWLIEEDKDFFMDEVTCHIIDPKDSSFPKREMKNYYLHFNPKQNYITLYTKKFNTKENEESPKTRLRG
ncbi:OmpH family outer membrane protein [Candidatus Phytoplasma australiense]|uniref:Uncharacterized protein n=1 Tax=Strawberry lethal yellows phytoplasma (CPA) str. NZSb11 TaxID=980422 RepID=R4RQY4_PHYAS|nr:OmpH family outer membrane protein [Candidatus Phytoplasma australiense]AGL90916.1 Hypothetical Protein SLY_1002 [Strawberry lethal yellows phytoplasma (CPA) str. NZSb11]